MASLLLYWAEFPAGKKGEVLAVGETDTTSFLGLDWQGAEAKCRVVRVLGEERAGLEWLLERGEDEERIWELDWNGLVKVTRTEGNEARTDLATVRLWSVEKDLLGGQGDGKTVR